jgi:hypothetical protein
MKGIIFTEFFELVEEKFGLAVADRIIEKAHLPHGGVYTTVGTYPHEEIVRLAVALSEELNKPLNELLEFFGYHLFGALHKGHPQFFEQPTDSLTFLASVHDYVHVEVKKLYPDAELPSFLVQKREDDYMELLYQSSRKFPDLARGLIKATIDHFGDEVVLEEEWIDPSGAEVRFIFKRK